MSDLSVLESWFSRERLTPYRVVTETSKDAAALYEWNADVSAAFWKTLGHVEVLVRNALHRTLTEWSQRTRGTDRWYIGIEHILSERTQFDIAEARRRATQTGRPETPGRVVAELNLGFWRYLLARRYDGTLWRACMYRAFPGKRRVRVERTIAELHQLRNRIGHHEPIHDRPLTELLNLALDVAGWVDPAARAWIADQDTSRQLVLAGWTNRKA